MPTPERQPLTRAVVLRGIGFGAAIVLGAVAVWLIVTGTTQKRLEIGVLTGLWGLLLGAYSMFGARRAAGEFEPPDYRDESRALTVREASAIERADDAAARRDFENRLERMVQREISNGVSREVASLRTEIAQLRHDLLEKVGGQLRLERIETTRLIGSDLEALQHEVRQLKVANASGTLGELRSLDRPTVLRPVQAALTRPDTPREQPKREEPKQAEPKREPPTRTEPTRAERPAGPRTDAARADAAHRPARAETSEAASRQRPNLPSAPAPAKAPAAQRAAADRPVTPPAASPAQSSAQSSQSSAQSSSQSSAPRTPTKASAPASRPAQPVVRPAQTRAPVSPPPSAAETTAERPRLRMPAAAAEPTRPAKSSQPAAADRAAETRPAAPAAPPVSPAPAAPPPTAAQAPEPTPQRDDPFAGLPRISPFTDFSLDPVESHAEQPAAGYTGRRRRGDDAADGSDAGRHASRGSAPHTANGTANASTNGASGAAPELAAGPVNGSAHSSANGHDTANGASAAHGADTANGAGTVDGGGRRRRRDGSDESSDLLSQLLARESSRH